MIHHLFGTVAELLPTRLILDVGGVGYDINIPLSTYDRLPQPGTTVKILTHLQIREDAHVLFGFATPEERDLFLLLVNNVCGIGPKLALAVLNGSAPVIFRGLVVAGDIAALSKIKGVGRRPPSASSSNCATRSASPRRGKPPPRSKPSRRRKPASTTPCSRSFPSATSRPRRTRPSAPCATPIPRPPWRTSSRKR